MRIKELRKGLGISQTKLGEYCGVTKGTISQYENEKREPDITTLKQLAAVFNCTIDYLIGGGESENFSEAEQQIIEYIKELTVEEVKELSNYLDFILAKRNTDEPQ